MNAKEAAPRQESRHPGNTTAHIVPPGHDKWARRRGVRARRQATAELHALAGTDRDDRLPEVDYHRQGFDLGLPERRAAGVRLLLQERAA